MLPILIDFQALLADFYFRLGKFELAQEQLTQIFTKNPEHTYALFVKAKHASSARRR